MVTAAALRTAWPTTNSGTARAASGSITWLHLAVVGGFLAIVLGVTTKALTAGSPHVIALGWIAIGLGAATVALGVAYVCLDALDTRPWL